MRKLIIISFISILHFSAFGQILEFDQLEMRYDQKQYSTTYKKAKDLMSRPEYDFSYVPRYYLALSKFQLAQNKRWLKRNKFAVEEATETFRELQQTKEGQALLSAHLYEISVLKSDLTHWMYQLNEDGDIKTFNQVKSIIAEFFADTPEASDMKEDYIKPSGEFDVKTPSKPGVVGIDKRDDILRVSEELLGVPYKWAGTTPQGFDCSGFTSYVFDKSMNKTLGRRAEDQYKDARKIKERDVRPGDFIFFSNGGGINHVGIVYSTNNNSIQMIHSSTSVGISVVDIYQSSYWKKRIKGFGTYVEN